LTRLRIKVSPFPTPHPTRVWGGGWEGRKVLVPPDLFISPPSLSEGLQGGTKPPVSHIIHHMGEEGEGNVAGAECALFFGVSDRTIIRREAKKGHKNPFVPLPSPATPPHLSER
jgi:hypothetical protein